MTLTSSRCMNMGKALLDRKRKRLLSHGLVLSLTCSLVLVQVVRAQHREATLQAISKGEAALSKSLQTENVAADQQFSSINKINEVRAHYRISFPPIEDFVIGILVNPCGANGTYGREDDIVLGYDCCMERFGQGEYAFRPGTRNRFSNGYSNGIPVGPDEPLHNIDLVDEFGNELDYRYSRRADDVVFIDESCRGLRDPHKACIADRFAAAKSPLTPPCWDNNQTVDSTLDCFSPVGKRQDKCMQVSYSQNAFIYVCGGEFANVDDCGTFLEIHKPNGSPYDDEDTVLSDSKIITPVTNGMQTTTISLTYKGDPTRIFCSYEEMKIQVGSMVRVKSDAPSCCCPQWLSPIRTSKIGAFFCPKRKGSKEGGPFALELRTLEEHYADDFFQQMFPWCPALEDAKKDVLMCTQERLFMEGTSPSDPHHYFMRPCHPVVEAEQGGYFESDDLSGKYSSACAFGDPFLGCGSAPSPWGGCHDNDHHFTFENEIGKVVTVPGDDKSKDEKHYGVTFNDGRSVYWFAEHELEFLKPDGNYEIWFVQRTRYEKIVQKKKPFRVIWPRCTYDSVNGQYFPFAMLDEDGLPETVL